MWLIYRINSTEKNSSPENTTVSEKWRLRQVQWGGVGCWCAWNGASI